MEEIMGIYCLSGTVNGRDIKPSYAGTREMANKKLEHILYDYNLQVEDTYQGATKHDICYRCGSYNTFFKISRI
jgi:hypothetical protein